MSVGGCSRGELTPVTPRTPDDADPDDDVYHRGPPKWRARMAKNLPPIPPAPRATEAKATSPRSSSRAFPSAPALERPKKSGRRSPASSPAPRERVAVVTPPSPASSPRERVVTSSPREHVVTSPPRGLTIVRE